MWPEVRTTKSSAIEEVDGCGSEGGECGKAASGEGDQWQGVSCCWRVVHGGSGRVSVGEDGVVARAAEKATSGGKREEIQAVD